MRVPRSPLKIAIAGGSIGGLSAGLALHTAGFDVHVYERDPGPLDARGAGIVVQPELLHLLNAGKAPTLPMTSCHVRRLLAPDGGDGQVRVMPQAFTSWESIYTTLRAAFPGNRNRSGAAVRRREATAVPDPLRKFGLRQSDGNTTRAREAGAAKYRGGKPKNG